MTIVQNDKTAHTSSVSSTIPSISTRQRTILPRRRLHRETFPSTTWSPWCLRGNATKSKLVEFEILLHTVLNQSQRSSPPPAQPAHGNFASCKARYSGAPDESLDGFIDAVEAYKECANVSETIALRGLSMLLTHEAATWWQGVKTTMNKWDHALTSLRGAFGDSRPPHRIYKELFANPQKASEKT